MKLFLSCQVKNLKLSVNVFSNGYNRCQQNHGPREMELLESNIQHAFISLLPEESQHRVIKSGLEYSPTLMHGHCCYSEQRTPNQPKMEEGEGQRERTGKETWQQ